MNRIFRLLSSAVVVCAALAALPAGASIVITGTRVIFPEKDGEVTVKMTNEGTVPGLAQVWLDTGDIDAAPDTIKVPFTLTPPLFRLDPKKGQTLRIIHTGEPLPQDKELVYFLNMLEAPPKPSPEKADQNLLQMAFRTRIKLFFRPKGLAPLTAPLNILVTWQLVPLADGNGYAIKASNPTAYHASFSDLKLKTGGKEIEADFGMVDPQSSKEFVVKDIKSLPTGPLEVEYLMLNDYGSGVKGNVGVSLGK
ncbi:MAG: fimbria/pilus periplasmic chaperone [Collimonas sp.]|uniref:fimbria/pilus periplasmic chaperone n=1 Tax=Collimonas sp. TaxID=1963772 RepID=UPI003265C86C